MPKTVILIVAAGRGQRAGGTVPKQYQKLSKRHVLSRTIEVFSRHPLVDQIATVIHLDDAELYAAATAEFGQKLMPPVEGGETRQDSVCKGLEALAHHNPQLVLIHDAARPFVDHDLINRIIEGLSAHDAVLPVIPVTDTIKQIEDGLVQRTVERHHLYGAQTPQGFRFPVILDLHRQAANDKNTSFTDDASIAESAGTDVHCVEGNIENIKLTTKRDMQMAELVLAKDTKTESRIGSGYDVHRFEPGAGVTLCGVTIPFDKQLRGHSDADVAMHALTDALYGALGEGDIGTHFPPDDPQWKDVGSAIFLAHAAELVRKQGGTIVNTDLTIICEQPKITPHRLAMRTELSRIMDIDAHRIAIKATTTETLGFTGRGEGIAAQAVAMISIPVKGGRNSVS